MFFIALAMKKTNTAIEIPFDARTSLLPGIPVAKSYLYFLIAIIYQGLEPLSIAQPVLAAIMIGVNNPGLEG